MLWVRLQDTFLLYVTKDDSRVQARPNKFGILLAVQEIQLSYREAGLGGRLEFTDKRKRQRRVIDTTMGTEEEARMRR